MRFNNLLALLLLIVIPFLWFMDANDRWAFSLPQDVGGALIMTWALVVQFYFRKSPPTNGDSGSKPA